MEFSHVSVLLNESIEGLNIQSGGIYVDCTVGGAGHSSEILKRLESNGHLYGFDQDAVAIETARARLSKISPQFTLIHTNFRNMKKELKDRGIEKVNGILFDLGVSSYQFDNGERGFSYNHDAVLDMRMDKRQDFNAYTLVNTWSEKDIADILFKYGEEKFSRQIARKIIDFRKVKPVEYKLFQVADLICSLELLNLKGVSNSFSKSEKEFFGSYRDFKKNYFKYCRTLYRESRSIFFQWL